MAEHATRCPRCQAPAGGDRRGDAATVTWCCSPARSATAAGGAVDGEPAQPARRPRAGAAGRTSAEHRPRPSAPTAPGRRADRRRAGPRRAGGARLPAVDGRAATLVTAAVAGRAAPSSRLAQLQPGPAARRHHAGRRRHGRPRVGARLPARPPAAPRPPHRLDARLVRRLPRLPLLHGGPEPADRGARRRRCPTASRSSSSPSRRARPAASRRWAFGRLAGSAFPGPPLLAVAAVPFLFDRDFTIYGGNIAVDAGRRVRASRSASPSPLLSLGVVARGLETGRHRPSPPSCSRSPCSAT